MYKYYPVVLNYTENDYNGLVWGQEAKPAANKSEYIRGVCVEKIPQRTDHEGQETKKKRESKGA